MTNQLIAVLASAGLAGASLAGTSATLSSSAIPLVVMAEGAPIPGSCLVRIFRAGAAGQFDVTRQVLKSGKCICNVLTGPAASNGPAEGQVSGILSSRSCADAPLAANAPGAAAGGAGGAAGGGSGFLIPGLLGAVGLGAGVAGAGGGGGSSSTGSSSRG